MKSMTGYGLGACAALGRQWNVEVRTVNHRFLDIKIRSPWIDAAFDAEVTSLLRQHVERGAITVTVREESTPNHSEIRVNVELAKSYHRALEVLRKELGLSDPVPLSLIVTLPNVMTSEDESHFSEKRFSFLRPAFAAALEHLLEMRVREGSVLAKDLVTHLEELSQIRERIAEFAKHAPNLQRHRLEERLRKLLRDGEVDPGRVAQEAAVLAERSDVSEEVVRLGSHLDQFSALMGVNGQVGRKLEFVLQEMLREVNTIASKLPSVADTNAEISERIICAKAELEKLREQVQNIE